MKLYGFLTKGFTEADYVAALMGFLRRGGVGRREGPFKFPCSVISFEAAYYRAD